MGTIFDGVGEKEVFAGNGMAVFNVDDLWASSGCVYLLLLDGSLGYIGNGVGLAY
jgi:hypothetical protein